MDIYFETQQRWTLDELRGYIAHEYLAKLPRRKDCKEIGLGLCNDRDHNSMELFKELCSIPSEEAAPLPITKLILLCKYLETAPFTALVEGLIHPNCRVTTLDMTSPICSDNIFYVFNELLVNENCKLETILMQEVEFKPEYAKRFAYTLTKNRVKRLELGSFPHAGWDALAKSLLAPTCCLDSLKISLPSCEMLSKFCDALSQRECKLTQLYFTGHDVEVALAARLTEALPISNIHTFSLEQCNMDASSQTRFAQCIQAWPRLKHLYLKQMEIPQHVVLTTALQSCIQLETLSMPFCNMEDMNFVCTMLQTTGNKLKELILVGNDLFDAGVAQVAECFELETCKVHTLNISYVQASEVGILALQHALRSPNCSLVKLDVNNGGLDDELEVTGLERALHYSLVGRLLLVLHSPRIVPRIASHTALRRLPVEMIRLVSNMM